MVTRDKVEINGVEYTQQELSGWTREGLQPLTREWIISQKLAISRSWLWVQGAATHRALLFGDDAEQFLGDDPIDWRGNDCLIARDLGDG